MVDSRLGSRSRPPVAGVGGTRVGSGEVRLLVLLTKSDKLTRSRPMRRARRRRDARGAHTDDADIGVTLFSA